jgi:hypothetical protein
MEEVGQPDTPKGRERRRSAVLVALLIVGGLAVATFLLAGVSRALDRWSNEFAALVVDD